MTMKVIRWAIFNGALMALLWCGLALDMAGPRNVGLFMVWATAIMSLTYCRKSVRNAVAQQGQWPYIPEWIDTGYDMLICGMLVWYGRWYSGAAWLVQLLLVIAMREGVREIRARSQK